MLLSIWIVIKSTRCLSLPHFDKHGLPGDMDTECGINIHLQLMNYTDYNVTVATSALNDWSLGKDRIFQFLEWKNENL